MPYLIYCRTRVIFRRVDRHLIFDIGACDGIDTVYYLSQGFRVVAVEANPASVRRLQSRFAAEIEQARLQIVAGAVTDQQGDQTLYLSNLHDEWASLYRELCRTEGEHQTVTVPAVNLAAVVQQFGVPYYAKIDIEGADLVAARMFSRLNERPRYMSIETGPTMEWLDGLSDIGYSKFKFIDQSGVPQLTQPSTRRNGKPAHQFALGSSGPFGEDTPGPWLGYEEAKSWFEEYLAKPGEKNLWFDIHAKYFPRRWFDFLFKRS